MYKVLQMLSLRSTDSYTIFKIRISVSILQRNLTGRIETKIKVGFVLLLQPQSKTNAYNINTNDIMYRRIYNVMFTLCRNSIYQLGGNIHLLHDSEGDI